MATEEYAPQPEQDIAQIAQAAAPEDPPETNEDSLQLDDLETESDQLFNEYNEDKTEEHFGHVFGKLEELYGMCVDLDPVKHPFAIRKIKSLATLKHSTGTVGKKTRQAWTTCSINC